MHLPNNFTPRSVEAVKLAQQEAVQMGHSYIGTEHLLLGLIDLNQGIAVSVLKKLGIDFDELRKNIEEEVKENNPTYSKLEVLPFTPRVKKVFRIAEKISKDMNHTFIGTEHLLLGILKEGEGLAVLVLQELDVDFELVREEVLSELDPNYVKNEPASVGKPSSKKETNHSKRVKRLLI